VPRLCEFNPGICLTTKEKARKKLSKGKKNLSQVKENLSQSTVYILPQHPHVTNPSQTHTCSWQGLPSRTNRKREARLRGINWSSTNGGFADGMVILPKKIKYSYAKTHSLGSKHKQNWINHLERMDNTRLPKNDLNYKPRGRRDRGRPRKRWQSVDAGTCQST